MDAQRLDHILDRLPSQRILVVGDFFLDKYLDIDRRLSEVSLETGREAHQVVGVRCSPGAAGTVTSNLRALGVQTTALGVIGDDGNGYELRSGLAASGVDIEPLMAWPGRFTPTYTKPMMHERDGRVYELERLDIKNYKPLPEDAQEAIIERLQHLAPKMHGVIIADQVTETGAGVISEQVRAALGALATEHPEVVFAADSRARIGLYRDIALKPNAHEAVLAVREGWNREIDLAIASECGVALSQRCGREVYVTVGDQGVLVCSGENCTHISAVPVSGEIDIVGAGDSCLSALVSARCAGAEPEEAALLGNLAASITVQQIGTTGTASPDQIRDRFQDLEDVEPLVKGRAPC
jgi:rfaE bifunctional protein kinase chain/domain